MQRLCPTQRGSGHCWHRHLDRKLSLLFHPRRVAPFVLCALAPLLTRGAFVPGSNQPTMRVTPTTGQPNCGAGSSSFSIPGGDPTLCRMMSRAGPACAPSTSTRRCTMVPSSVAAPADCGYLPTTPGVARHSVSGDNARGEHRVSGLDRRGRGGNRRFAPQFVEVPLNPVIFAPIFWQFLLDRSVILYFTLHRRPPRGA